MGAGKAAIFLVAAFFIVWRLFGNCQISSVSDVGVGYAFAMEVEYFTFTLPPDAWRKKPQPSAFKMTREEAAKRYPGATPIESTREVRRQDGPKLIPGGSAYGQ